MEGFAGPQPEHADELLPADWDCAVLLGGFAVRLVLGDELWCDERWYGRRGERPDEYADADEYGHSAGYEYGNADDATDGDADADAAQRAGKRGEWRGEYGNADDAADGDADAAKRAGEWGKWRGKHASADDAADGDTDATPEDADSNRDGDADGGAERRGGGAAAYAWGKPGGVARREGFAGGGVRFESEGGRGLRVGRCGGGVAEVSAGASGVFEYVDGAAAGWRLLDHREGAGVDRDAVRRAQRPETVISRMRRVGAAEAPNQARSLATPSMSASMVARLPEMLTSVTG